MVVEQSKKMHAEKSSNADFSPFFLPSSLLHCSRFAVTVLGSLVVLLLLPFVALSSHESP